MSQVKLITYNQIAEYKLITSNINASKFDNLLIEAQELDLRPILGNELYLELIAENGNSPYPDKYANLLEGCTYTYNGKSYKHEGLIPVLAYFIYARFLAYAGSVATPYGVVQKTNDFSQPTSDKSISRQITQAKSAAMAYFDRVKLFLIHNKTIYTTYLFNPSTRNSGLRINPVGGNDRSDNKYNYRY